MSLTFVLNINKAFPKHPHDFEQILLDDVDVVLFRNKLLHILDKADVPG